VVHPRSSISTTTSSSTKTKAREISNLDEVTGWIYQWFQRREKQSRMVPPHSLTMPVTKELSIRILPLYNMSFYDQLRAIRESQVLIGNHGAGLTHFIFMNDDNVGTVTAAHEHATTPLPLPHAIEFRGPGYDTFRNMMAWKPRVHYQQLPSLEYNMSRPYFDNVLRPVLNDILFSKPRSRNDT
jgi:Glycosyltransferase 61